ncbi:MAG: hypothetical protein ABFD81_10235, partial [Syntrophaceae bacterium]
MNRRLIARVIQKKHDDFIQSIRDEHVRDLVDKNSIITGGSIASMLLGERINDFDYYFTDKATVLAVAKYYVAEFNALHPNVSVKPEVREDDQGRVKIWVQSAGITGEDEKQGTYKYFENHPDQEAMDYIENVVQTADETDSAHIEEMDQEKGKYRPVFLSANAITLSDKVQLVIRFYGNAEEIHKNYDFIHCCNYWTSQDGKLTLNPGAIESLLCKHLQYQGSLYPLCSVIRTRKFLKAGWYINAGQYLKMCFQISELDLSSLEVLEDQLTGVDA